MGEPAELTAGQRADVLAWAHAVVESVQHGELFPLNYTRHAEQLEYNVLAMAQEVVRMSHALERVRMLLTISCHCKLCWQSGRLAPEISAAVNT